MRGKGRNGSAESSSWNGIKRAFGNAAAIRTPPSLGSTTAIRREAPVSLRQAHHERRSLSRLALHLDGSAVEEDEVAGDGQAEAGAGDGLGAALVDAVEAAEDPVALGRWDPFAVIRDAHDGGAAALGDVD